MPQASPAPRPRSPAPAAVPGLTIRAVAPALGLAHLALQALTNGVRNEHLAGDLLLVFLPWMGRAGADFIRTVIPLWIGGVIEDSQWIWMPLRGEIHTGGLARLDAALFPAPGGVSWPVWFSEHTHSVLDVVAGAAYLTYLPEILGVAFVLAFVDRRRGSALAIAFAVVHVLGAIVYMAVPAAPPWYVMAHGPGPADVATAVSSPAGALRFDELLGVTWFQTFYSRNPNIFAAMPSLHVAYPVMVLWFARGRWRLPAALYAALVAFAAVYLTHHWVVDVVAGALAGVVSCAAADAIRRRLDGPAQARQAAEPAPTARSAERI